MAKTNILNEAIIQLNAARRSPKRDVPLAFKVENEAEARATAAAIVYANNCDRSEEGRLKAPLDTLLVQHGFGFDDKTKTCRVTLLNAQLRRSQPWTDAIPTMIERIQTVRDTVFCIAQFGSEEAMFREIGDGINIVPLTLEHAKHFVPMQARLLTLMADYHGIPNFRGGTMPVADIYAELAGGNHAPAKMRAAAGLTTSRNEPARVERRLTDMGPSKALDLDGMKRDAARKPVAVTLPADLNQKLGNMALHAPANRGEQAQLLTHAVRAVAAAMDVRSDATLDTADYDAATRASVKTRIDMHKRLAELLLTEETIHNAACSCDLGQAFSPKMHKNLGAARTVARGKTAGANTGYLREHKEARDFLEQISPTVPGLTMLIQGATLPQLEAESTRSQNFWGKMKNRSAGDIIQNEPQLWDAQCIRFLDSHCSKSPAR